MKCINSILALVLVLTTLLTACAPAVYSPETTEATQMKNIYQKEDPAKDDTLNILMIGNSLCYYYVEELYGMLNAAGIKANVCNVYYSGCSLKQHWTWWKNGEAHCDYFITNGDGRVKTEGVNLEWCLQQQNWDVISLQDSPDLYSAQDPMAEMEARKLYRTELWEYIKEQFPMSRYLWHQAWARQVGFGLYVMESAEKQQYIADQMHKVDTAICKEQNLERVCSGDAWQIVRNEHGYDKLCARIGKGEPLHSGDNGHDGDWGGGQYLSACVWFEVVTGGSCLGNTYRPQYSYNGEDMSPSEELIQMLQQSAHKAVEEMKTGK